MGRYAGRGDAYSIILSAALLLAGCGVSSPLPVGSVAPDNDDDSDERPAPRDEPDEPDEPPAAAPVDEGNTGTSEPAPRLPCGTGDGCDPTDLGGETCQSLGLGEGRLLCDPATCAFEISLCSGTAVAAPCGTGRGCDPANLGGETCGSLGMGEGSLLCDPMTCTFDTSLCSGGLFGTGGTGSTAPGTGFFGSGTQGTGGTGGTTGFFGSGFFGGAEDMDGGV